MRPAVPSAPPTTRGTTGGGFIAELHGVRGIALLLVVLFHVFGQGRVSGGVDVFLFFSGFLLTGSMYRRSVARSRGRVSRHYTRTLLRLLPAAFVVLATVTVAVMLLRPLSDRPQDLREIRASLLYVENWELISSQLAYGAAGPDASPLQHFWSLSLQGQFFVVWPLLVVALVALGRPRGAEWAVTTAGVALLTGLMFAAAQVMVRADQQVAYFHGVSRWWELTAGGLLALLLMRWRPADGVRSACGWAGVAVVAGTGFVVDGGHAFPGPWVLLPLAGAALVLVGAGGGKGPRRLLGTRPLTWLADIAYELYLWHWPILVLVLVVQGRDVVGPRTAALILVVSTVAAWLTHVLVSRPFLRLRDVSPHRILLPAVVTVTAAAVLLSMLTVRTDDTLAKNLDVSSYTLEGYPGAEAVRTPELAEDSYPLPIGPPLDVAARNDEDALGSKCWQWDRGRPGELQWCDGPTTEDGPLVLLVGGSRALMWHPAMQEAARQNGWILRATARGSCPLQLDAEVPDCRDWNEAVLDDVLRMRPDAVFVEGTEIRRKGIRDEYLEPRKVAAWEQLTDAGIDVVGLRAGPRFLEGPPACIMRVGARNAQECARPADELYREVSPFTRAAAADDRLHEVDLTSTFCPDGSCPVVLGNLVTNRDRRHFTAAFSHTLAGSLADQVTAALPALAPDA